MATDVQPAVDDWADKMTEAQAEAWAAGYFDSRGGYHFKIGGQIMLIFTDKDREVLNRFCEILGHGWVRSVKGTSNALQLGAREDILEVTRRFRPLVVRKRLIADMDRVLAGAPA